MAAIVIAAAGAGIGWAVGGTLNAALIGWSIGSMLAPKPTQQVSNTQPQIDLRVTGSEYGQPIPWIKGTVGIAGQMWWNTDRRATSTTTVTESGGGKGGGGGTQTTTTTTVYDMDALIGLTDNEIIGISRIWNNGKLIYTADVSATGGSLAASVSSQYWTRLTVYTGASDQLPDPTYEAAVTTAEACAYRGRSYVFIAGLKLGQSGQVPNLTFEVVGAGTDAGAVTLSVAGTGADDIYEPSYSDAWYATANLTGKVWATTHIGGAYNLSLVDIARGEIDFTISNVNLGTNYAIIGVDENGYALVQGVSPTVAFRVDLSGAIQHFTVGSYFTYGAIGENGNVWINYGFGSVVKYSDIDWAAHTSTSTNTTGGGGFGRFLRNAAGISGRVYGVCLTGGTIGWADTTTMAITTLATVAPEQLIGALIGGDGNIYAFANGGHVLYKYDQDGALLGSLTLATTLGYSYHVGIYDQNGFVWVIEHSPFDQPWTKINASTMEIESTAANGYPPASARWSHMIGEAYEGIPVVYGLGTNSRGKLGVISDVVTSAPPSVQSVQSDICLRAGLTAGQIDVTGLSSITRTVRSLAWSQISSARSITELMMATYFYEMVTSDKIYFRPRGSASVATIPYADLGASVSDDQPEPFALRKANELEVPAQIALTYINVSDDYQNDTQYSDRLVSSAAGTVATVQMAIGMTPAEAKGVADVMLLDQTVGAVTAPIALLGDYCRLEPTDPITVTDAAGATFRMRIVKKNDSFPLLGFEMVLDDVSILTSQEITSADYAPETVVDPPVNTYLKLLDIPILRDADDDAGFYVATKGDGTPYPGSAVFYSSDDVEYTRKATVLESAVFGLCTTTLGDWSGSRMFDEINTVTVNVGSGTLSSSTRAAVLDSLSVNAILIGSEVIQFLIATLVSTGVYTLSRLLRGCRGTEWAMTGHAANERAVLLSTDGMRRVLLQNNELGLSLYYKGVTLGRALSSATAQTFTNTAIGRKSFSPIIFKAGRDASNNITFEWQRRTRLAVRMIGSAGISAPLGEDSEAYEIDVYSNSGYTTVVRTISATTTSASYTAAQQTTDGLTPGNTVYCKIYQISEQVGRGYVLQKAA